VSNRIGWLVAIAILAAGGFYGYSCIRVNQQDSEFRGKLDEMRRVLQNHNARFETVTLEMLLDDVIELAAEAGIALGDDDIEITAEPIAIARDDDDGCVVQEWPPSAMELSEIDQGRLSVSVSQDCNVIPRWIIGIRAETDVRSGLVSRQLVYERYLLAVRYDDK
jgi:hypothetical protein